MIIDTITDLVNNYLKLGGEYPNALLLGVIEKKALESSLRREMGLDEFRISGKTTYRGMLILPVEIPTFACAAYIGDIIKMEVVNG